MKKLPISKILIGTFAAVVLVYLFYVGLHVYHYTTLGGITWNH